MAELARRREDICERRTSTQKGQNASRTATRATSAGHRDQISSARTIVRRSVVFKEVELERLDAVARESIRANRHSAQKARAKPAARAGEQGEVMGGEGWQLAARAQRGREFELWCRAHLASAWRLLLSRWRHASRPRSCHAHTAPPRTTCISQQQPPLFPCFLSISHSPLSSPLRLLPVRALAAAPHRSAATREARVSF